MANRIGQYTVIEPTVILGDNIYIGNNVTIRDGVVIEDDVVIGHAVTVELNARICRGTHISPKCNVTADIIVGAYNFWGSHVITSNDKEMCYMRKEFISNPPKIGSYVRIGSRSIIGAGVVIGDNAMVGMGSVVTKDIPAGELWYGNPAKYVRDVPADELLRDLEC